LFLQLPSTVPFGRLLVALRSETPEFLAEEEEHDDRLQAKDRVEEVVEGLVSGALTAELMAILEASSEHDDLQEGRKEDERADASEGSGVLFVFYLRVTQNPHEVPEVAPVRKNGHPKQPVDLEVDEEDAQ